MNHSDDSPEQELAAIVALGRQEQSGDYEPLTLHLGPFAAYTLVAALQLVCRHSAVSGDLKQRIEQIARDIQDGFTDPAVSHALERGWDETQDVPREDPF